MIGCESLCAVMCGSKPSYKEGTICTAASSRGDGPMMVARMEVSTQHSQSVEDGLYILHYVLHYVWVVSSSN